MFGHRQNRNALEPPPIADGTSQAEEVLRVWSVPGGPQQVVLRTSWEDPGAWGLLLVDVARHVAEAYAKAGHDPADVIERIRELFDAEWSNPTDEPLDLSGA